MAFRESATLGIRGARALRDVLAQLQNWGFFSVTDAFHPTWAPLDEFAVLAVRHRDCALWLMRARAGAAAMRRARSVWLTLFSLCALETVTEFEDVFQLRNGVTPARAARARAQPAVSACALKLSARARVLAGGWLTCLLFGSGSPGRGGWVCRVPLAGVAIAASC